jgi:hypothetical protein
MEKLCMRDLVWCIGLFLWEGVYRANGYVLAMVGYLKNVSPTFAQMPDRITNVEFTTVSPTIANTMLAVVFLNIS